MNKLFFTLVLTAFSLMGYAQTATDNFAGKWKTDKGELIEISKSGDVFIGKAGQTKTTVLDNVRFSNGKWMGTLIKPKDGEKVDGTLTLKGDKINILVKKGMISKTIVWTKA